MTDQYRQGNEVPISKGNTIACPLCMVQRALEVSQQTSNTYSFRPVFRSGHTCALIHKGKFLIVLVLEKVFWAGSMK